MSSSFFLKGNAKPDKKRKFTTNKKDNKKPRKDLVAEKNQQQQQQPIEDDNEEIHSEDEEIQENDSGANFAFSDEDEDQQTPQDKRLRLAKKYLDEIEKEEASRAEDKELYKTVSTRLNDEYLSSVGKLRKKIAHEFLGYNKDKLRVIKNKLHKLPVTCVVLSSDNKFIFSGSKTQFVIKWDAVEAKVLASFDCTTTTNISTGGGSGGGGNGSDKNKKSRPQILALALSTNMKFLAIADSSQFVQIICPVTMKHLHTFQGHRDTVTALVFRKDTHSLYSASKDRSVKIWSLDEFAYIESLFGHQASITGIDALSRERAITSGGCDCSIRIWKITEESQLIYNGHRGNIENVKLINEENFVSSGDDGSLCVWSVMKKKPLCVKELAHGKAANGEANWISAIATHINSDIIASAGTSVTGSCDGSIKLWKLGDNYRTIVLMFEIPIVGFVNMMAFTSDAKQMVVAVGQEHRLGRWWRIKEGVNSIVIIPFERNLTTE